MKKILGATLIVLLVMMLFALVGGTVSIAEDSGDSPAAGQAVFEAQKCNTCHSVPGVGIVAKTKSATLQGPNLPTATIKDAGTDRDLLLQFVRKEAEFEGKKHKKGAKATDDELNTILDWLAEQEEAAAE
jgi:mono/diheme cytochrome c family protein